MKAHIFFLLIVLAKTVIAQSSYVYSVTQSKIDPSIGEAEDVAELIAPYTAKLQAAMNQVIGFAPKTIDKHGPGSGALGRLMAEVLKEAVAKSLHIKVDLGVQNPGGIRAEIPAGNITVGTIYRLMPFENEIAVVDMTGQQLELLFQEMGSRIKDFGAAVAGAHLTYKNGQLVSAKISGKKIERNKIYKVALTDYLHKGGGDYPILWEGKNYRSAGLTFRDALLNYVKQKRKLIAPKDANIKVEE
ncbi:MAG: 5'-nucleotidase [Acidobacteriota bacterium]|nr:5'-nucleotidase C-terminal domain-containing protein [Blastocatellia bacterium]MDW8411812.1 5'-nucleotidase [Acidobacteriota bacterium]